MKKLALLFILVIPVFSFSQVIHIPADYPAIQYGIDAAEDGDTVLVTNGIYFESINFKGKAITVASYYLIDNNETHIDSTIIDCSGIEKSGSDYAVYFVNQEDSTSILTGFTLKYVSRELSSTGDMVGGGVFIKDALPKMHQNKIVGEILVRQNPKTYITWITLKDQQKKLRGSLYRVNDSSLSFIEGVRLKQNSKIYYEPPKISFDQINTVKIRNKNSIKTGIFAGLFSGVVAGVIYGSIEGRRDTGYEKVNKSINAGNAAAYGVAFGAIGAGIGALIGSIKISIPIAENKKKIEDYKKKMKNYAIKQ